MSQKQERDGGLVGPIGWGFRESAACGRLVRLALEEDLGDDGDLTSRLLPAGLKGQAVFVARAAGVVAGLPILAQVFQAIANDLKLTIEATDGQAVHAGRELAKVSGSMRAMLTGERTALNFLQRLSGVATLTQKFVAAVAGLPCQILDTRKTTPGWRRLEKYAVRCGGGKNHRMGLNDGVMFKDNHLAALAGAKPDAISDAVREARAETPADLTIEVEVETLEQLDQALAARPDMILLDNMDLDNLAEAVRRRNQIAPRVRLEASGGVTLTTVRAIAETGVDFISVGALTHSAPALDIALDYQK
jgi:nicotinate-nucleotide pyrophosphorylase (carboxylating)